MTTYSLTRCVVCDSAESVTVAGAEDVKAETELLWEFQLRRLKPGTPPERLLDRVAFSQDPPWRVVRCTTCALVYRNPAEAPRELRSVYEDGAIGDEHLRELHDTQVGAARSQLRRLLAHDAVKGAGLEVGSYSGAFLTACAGSAWRFEGLDVNPRVNAFSRSLGHIVHDGDLESFRPDRSFDAIAVWNTFDQLPDPRSALRGAVRLLRPGGVLAIRVPNGDCYAAWRPRLFGGAAPARAFAVRLLAHNNLLSFPYRFGFTPASLTRLLADAGLRVTAIVGDVLVPVNDRWTRSWASLEARAMKPLTRRWMPWFEVYASH